MRRVRGIPQALAGLTLEVDASYLYLGSKRALDVITTAPLGGELTTTSGFFSLPAPPMLDYAEPTRPISAAAESLGIDGPMVGFMTAVHLQGARVSVERAGAIAVLALATVGVTNASRPGEEVVEGYAPGTINTVVVIDARLSRGALHEALALTAEAKALAIYEGGARTRAGLPATGTSTDAYAVACTGAGAELPYAGPVTEVGFLVGRAVRSVVGEGLLAALRRTQPTVLE